MNVYFTDRATKALDAKMAFIKGKGAQNLSLAIAREVKVGNTYDRMNGRDRYGVALTPLKSKRTGVYKNALGYPLTPFGPRSRAVKSFDTKARQRDGKWQIVAGWINVVSKSGVPFLPFHDLGSGHLPRRSIFGISPRTWAKIKVHIDNFKNGVKIASISNPARSYTVKSRHL